MRGRGLRWQGVLGVVLGLSGLLRAERVDVRSDTARKPYGIDRRIPLTTSKVVGSPEPPPPYRVRRVYPDLKISYPIHVVHQPGSDRLIAIGEASPYGAVKILRFKD